MPAAAKGQNSKDNFMSSVRAFIDKNITGCDPLHRSGQLDPLNTIADLQPELSCSTERAMKLDAAATCVPGQDPSEHLSR